MRTRTFDPCTVASIAALILLCGCAVQGDYGDAPDGAPTGYPGTFAQAGAFPTLSANGGAVADDTTVGTLGPGASEELDANDPADPDGQPNLAPSNTDADDGLTDFVLLLVSIPPPAMMSVNVTAPAAGGGAFWVNVLIDLNLDGAWGGSAGGLPEWVVQNFPVQLAPGASTQVALPPFFFGLGNRLPDGAWMRVALTSEAIGGTDWDGTGSFGAGEVEDHTINLPPVGGGAKRIIISMSCRDRELFPRGAVAILFTCQVRNIALGATAGTFSYTMNGLPPNGPSVRVLPRPAAANRGCVGACPLCPPGGPVACGQPPPPGTIPIAGAGPVNLRFIARRLGPLPSHWSYSAVAEDPPAVITPEGVLVGYGPSTGTTSFEEVDIEREARIEISDDMLVVHVRPVGGSAEATIPVIVDTGETFGGYTYDALLEHGNGTIQLETGSR